VISRDFWLYPLSSLGLCISAYVWYSQSYGKPIACWTRDCDRVIRSSYSRLLGVHNSTIGFWLYLSILLVNSLRHLGLEPWPTLASSTISLLAFIGTLVSLYLTYIQLFVLKGICNWCLTSSALILTIFLTTLR